MKITFVTSGSVKSNFTYRVLQLSRSLKKRGHDVSIMGPVADKYNNFIPEKIKEIDGVKIIQPFQFKTKRIEINLLPYIIHATFLMIRNKSDLIYIYKPTPISIVGLLGKLFHGAPVVLDMDDLGSEVMKIEGHPLHQIKLVEWCEKIVGYYADRIVTASTYLEKYFKHKYSYKSILVISNAVDSDWFKPIRFSEEKNRIIFLGAMNRKNILEPLFDVLPGIIKKIPDVKVVIMGGGLFLDYFKKKVEKLSLSGYVEFTGWLNLSDAQNRMYAGDLGYNYMPDEVTTRAASNMKVPQYMARGVLPFVSIVGDLPTYVSDGAFGYMCPADNNILLEQGIIDALLDAERFKKSEGASKFSFHVFNWDVIASTFEQWVGGKDDDKTNNTEKRDKKVFFVTITVPGNVGGAEIRNFNLVKQWASVENTVVSTFCISTENESGDSLNMREMSFSKNNIIKKSQRTLWRTIRSVLWNRMPPFMNDFSASGIGDVVKKACEEGMPDVIHFEQVHAYYAMRRYIPWLKSKGVKIVLDCHNVEFQVFKDSLDVFPFMKRMIGKSMVSTLKKIEIEAVSISDAVFACSEEDASFFRTYNSHTYVVPNGVDTAGFECERNVFNKKIIFMGGVGYPPNEDAVRFYLTEIHPRIKKQVPDVTVTLIGAEDEWLEKNNLYDPSVTGLGFVESVKPYLADAGVGVCPIRYGSGTRLKILTYMAASLPVVSTYKGAEGVGYTNGENIFLVDNPVLFADAVVSLLKNEYFAHSVGTLGHDFVKSQYDWNVIGENLLKIYKKII